MEILLLIINLILLAGLFLYSFLTYKNLPNKIPIHFGITGKANHYASKIFFWVLPILSLIILYFSCFSLCNVAHFSMNELRSEHHFEEFIGGNIPALLNIVILLLFIDIQNSIHRVAREKSNKMNKSVWFWFILIIVLAFLI